MITYKYKAISKDGAQVSGIVEAYDEYTAVAQIKETCRLVTKITPVQEKSSILTKELGSKRVNLKALSVMCSQFAIILTAGMPAAKCVELIADQTSDKKLRKILIEAARDVTAGHSMADSFENVDREAFPTTFLETVRSGEQSGTVENVFKNLSIYYEKQYKTRQKVSAALSYPLFVIGVAIVVVMVIMVKVIPTMTGIFKDLGGAMPLPTQLLISMSDFFKNNILVILMVTAVAVILFLAAMRTEDGRLRWNRFKLKIPVFGEIGLLNASGQFANTMSTLLAAGLSVPRALEVTAKTLDNYMLAMETAKMVTGLEEGRRLGNCMRERNCYPRTLNEMCAIGEETGELEETLKTIGTYFDNEAEHATQKAISKLEPTILVLMALVAGFIVISVYLPVFTMYDLM